MAGVGEKIEQRPNYTGQIPSEIRWALGACAIVAGYFYLSFGFIDTLYPSSWIFALGHIFGFIVAYDLYMYVTHKGLHSDALRSSSQSYLNFINSITPMAEGITVTFTLTGIGCWIRGTSDR